MYTISDIKRINAEKGMFYFSPDTMRFFRSRVNSSVFEGRGGVYFITSEQFIGSNGVAAPRRFTIRKFDPETGKINTTGEFNTYKTFHMAAKDAKRLAGV